MVYVPDSINAEILQKGVKHPQLGAAFAGNYSKLPSTHAAVTWEVDYVWRVPARVRPLKPKFYLLRKVTLKRGLAYRLL